MSIETASVVDGGDRKTLITESIQLTHITGIVIDFHSTNISLIVDAKLERNVTCDDPTYIVGY